MVAFFYWQNSLLRTIDSSNILGEDMNHCEAASNDNYGFSTVTSIDHRAWL